MEDIKITTIEQIFYRPSDKAKKILIRKINEVREDNPRMPLNALVDMLVIQSDK